MCVCVLVCVCVCVCVCELFPFCFLRNAVMRPEDMLLWSLKPCSICIVTTQTHKHTHCVCVCVCVCVCGRLICGYIWVSNKSPTHVYFLFHPGLFLKTVDSRLSGLSFFFFFLCDLYLHSRPMKLLEITSSFPHLFPFYSLSRLTRGAHVNAALTEKTVKVVPLPPKK